VGHDDAGDSGSEIRPDEYGRRSSGTSTIVDRDTEVTNADRVMRVVPGVEETNVGAVERAVREQKVAVVGRARHGSIVRMREGEMARTVICFREATQQESVRSSLEMDRIRGGKRDILVSDGDGDGADGWGFEAVFEIQVVEVCRFLLESDGIVVVVVVSIGGREGSVHVFGRFILQDPSHGTVT
jgi:hypothetical protein